MCVAFLPLLYAHKFRTVLFLLIDFFFFMVNGNITSHVSAESLVFLRLMTFKE